MKSHKLLAVSVVLLLAGPANAATDPVDEQIRAIQTRWAEITYKVVDEDRKNEEYEALEAAVQKVIDEYPGRPEPKIWEGIILSTDAGVSGGLSALTKVKTAKTLLEEAIAIDDAALDGSAHTSLGSLYYQVPVWPVAFRNENKAEQHLTHALEINPNGIDPNYFYGDYLYRQGRYEEATRVLSTALSAPDRDGRPLADAGRRQEIRALMDKVKEKIGS